MKTLIVLCTIVAIGSARPGYVTGGAIHQEATVALTREGVPVDTPEVQAARAAHLAAHAHTLATMNGNNNDDGDSSAGVLAGPVATYKTFGPTGFETYGISIPGATMRGIYGATLPTTLEAYKFGFPNIVKAYGATLPSGFGIHSADLSSAYGLQFPSVPSVFGAYKSALHGASFTPTTSFTSASLPAISADHSSAYGLQLASIPSALGAYKTALHAAAALPAAAASFSPTTSLASSDSPISIADLSSAYGLQLASVPSALGAYKTALHAAAALPATFTSVTSTASQASGGSPSIIMNSDGGYSYSYTSGQPAVQGVVKYRYNGPETKVVLTPAGVPVDTPEVQAARAANAIAHQEAMARNMSD